MNWIVNLLSKITGIDSAAKKLDGANTKLGAVATILSGVAALIIQWVGMPHDVASILAFLKSLPSDPALLAITAGWAALGLGRKMDKATAAMETKGPDTPSSAVRG